MLYIDHWVEKFNMNICPFKNVLEFCTIFHFTTQYISEDEDHKFSFLIQVCKLYEHLGNVFQTSSFLFLLKSAHDQESTNTVDISHLVHSTNSSDALLTPPTMGIVDLVNSYDSSVQCVGNKMKHDEIIGSGEASITSKQLTAPQHGAYSM